jgi:hypothetical protein
VSLYLARGRHHFGAQSVSTSVPYPSLVIILDRYLFSSPHSCGISWTNVATNTLVPWKLQTNCFSKTRPLHSPETKIRRHNVVCSTTVQRVPKVAKITITSFDRLAMSNDNCGAKGVPLSSPLHHRSRAKLVMVEFVIVDKRKFVMLRTIAITVTNEDNCTLEQPYLKPHEWTRKPTESQKIRQINNSMCPPPVLGPPLERVLKT